MRPHDGGQAPRRHGRTGLAARDDGPRPAPRDADEENRRVIASYKDSLTQRVAFLKIVNRVIPRYSEGSRASRVVRISRFLGIPRNDDSRKLPVIQIE